jgi:ion channel
MARWELSTLLMRLLGSASLRSLLRLWFWGIVGFGLVFWLAGLVRGHGLVHNGTPVEFDLEGLMSSVYFSFVTALSIGYGDVLPSMTMRIVAVIEGFGGLLIFGCVISKLVSQHQEELTEEIHRITFEDRLGRVRTNLHMVLSDLQTLAGMCADPASRPERLISRVESATAVFLGEMQAIHDLLYRPQQTPDEMALAAILANLAAALREFHDLQRCLPASHRESATLQSNVRGLVTLAGEICGECVPRAYAPDLKEWMDRIQDLAHRLT